MQEPLWAVVNEHGIWATSSVAALSQMSQTKTCQARTSLALREALLVVLVCFTLLLDLEDFKDMVQVVAARLHAPSSGLARFWEHLLLFSCPSSGFTGSMATSSTTREAHPLTPLEAMRCRICPMLPPPKHLATFSADLSHRSDHPPS